MNFDLNKFNIFIAGGLGEIGSFLVKELLKEKASVIILYSSNKSSYKSANFEQKDNLKIIKTDYSDYEKLKKDLFNNAQEYKTNCLISTVGSGKMTGEYPYKKEEVSKVWDINYFFNRNLATSISEIISKNHNFNPDGYSSHIFTSSIASSKNVNAPFEYCASKSALETLVKNLSIYISPFQRVNTISPGHIFTDEGTWGNKRKNNPKEFEKIVKKIPLQRIGNCSDIINMYLFLLSKHSAYLTGSNIIIDGGISAKQ
tara:strand:+ start:6708 stop:7481 length:774 start_codon:yes stop_codon:yes gene_type:complete